MGVDCVDMLFSFITLNFLITLLCLQMLFGNVRANVTSIIAGGGSYAMGEGVVIFIFWGSVYHVLDEISATICWSTRFKILGRRPLIGGGVGRGGSVGS